MKRAAIAVMEKKLSCTRQLPTRATQQQIKRQCVSKRIARAVFNHAKIHDSIEVAEVEEIVDHELRRWLLAYNSGGRK
jgi:DNA-binding protein Fis